MTAVGRAPPQLQLYVAGTSVRSIRAISNIRGICDLRSKDGYDLEIIDIFERPELAEEENIIASPTLIRRRPLPIRRVVGDMSDTERVISLLDM